LQYRFGMVLTRHLVNKYVASSQYLVMMPVM
jgi:hypothetical protein